jgi:hypothetical protein
VRPLVFDCVALGLRGRPYWVTESLYGEREQTSRTIG